MQFQRFTVISCIENMALKINIFSVCSFGKLSFSFLDLLLSIKKDFKFCKYFVYGLHLIGAGF